MIVHCSHRVCCLKCSLNGVSIRKTELDHGVRVLCGGRDRCITRLGRLCFSGLHCFLHIVLLLEVSIRNMPF